MPVRTCDHLKEDGVYCGSPALNGRNYCYFHLNLRGRRLKAARARRRGDNPALNLPFPEDMHAVQVCLAEIMWALADDRIETKRAWAILNSLQQASTNLNRTPGWQGEREGVPSNRPLRALNDPNFEKRYGLPPDVDLNADPEPTPPDQPAQAVAFDRALKGHGFSRAAEAPDFCSSERVSAREDDPTCDSIAPLPGCSSGGSQLPEVGNCGDQEHNLPDRVPVPEDELRELNMTRWEEMEFFVYKFRFNQISEEEEQELKVAWLREKRGLTQEEFAAAQLTGSEDPLLPLDGPEYTDRKRPPFGFGNMLGHGDDDESEDDAAEAA